MDEHKETTRLSVVCALFFMIKDNQLTRITALSECQITHAPLHDRNAWFISAGQVMQEFGKNYHVA